MYFSVLFDKFAQRNVKYEVVTGQVHAPALSGYKQSEHALLPSLILLFLISKCGVEYEGYECGP